MEYLSRMLWEKKFFLILLVMLPFFGCAKAIDQQQLIEIENAENNIHSEFERAIAPSLLSDEQRKSILSQYQHLDPKKEIPTDLLEQAVIYFDANKAHFPNQSYITIIDYKKKSPMARFFVVDIKTGLVEKFHTSHGRGSDTDNDGFAEQFSNIPRSDMSSLGFARTAETFSGRFRRSLRLDGLSNTNSLLRRRAIVVHGWNNTHEADVL